MQLPKLQSELSESSDARWKKTKLEMRDIVKLRMQRGLFFVLTHTDIPHPLLVLQLLLPLRRLPECTHPPQLPLLRCKLLL